jgi:glycerate-2-kinase
MPSRVDVMKKLSDTLKTLIALERQAFGIDGKETEAGGAIESVIKRVMARQGNCG